ncbi:putative cytokinetic ring protein SteA [Nocardioides sp. KR10-350]|uniref:putative cytokinetic ring protein SteA n=1 Tax=Nocardioides cheoyonin TaxID=3156615 RepID=UPI0032B38067
MRFPTRQIATVLPGVRGTLRAERPTRALLPRLRAGDVAVIDHTDLDRNTAQAMIDAGVVAVVNARPMVSGRFPNRGPEMLAEAGVLMLDGIGEGGYSSLADGRRVRIHEGQVYDGEQRLTEGREVDLALVREEMERARAGMSAQLETFTHNSTELLRREQDVLLHSAGVPRLGTRVEDRPVVVVVEHPDSAAQLRGLRSFVKEQHPVLVAVGGAVDLLQREGLRADVVVLGPDADALPGGRALKAARDVVVAPGTLPAAPVTEALERMAVESARFVSAIAAEDAALLLVHAHHPRLVVGVGMSATLTDFLEHQRPGLASTYLTRLALGPTLVDAATVPTLYSGRVRKRHLLLALLVCLLVVAAAVATTDVGQDWYHHLGQQLHQLLDRVSDAGGGS